MGWGDDVMVTAYARIARQENPEAKAVFGDPETFFDPETGKIDVYWSAVFKNNPNIYQPLEEIKKVVCVPYYKGNQAYIDYENSEYKGTYLWKFAFRDDFRAPKGDLFFTDDEIAEADRMVDSFPKGFILVEPSVKGAISINKAWPIQRWAALIERLSADYGIVQLAKTEEGPWLDKLPGAKNFVGAVTSTFRSTCAVLRRARLFVGVDGGLHHASAALDVPAVVLWSGFTSPKHLGYTQHINIGHFDFDAPCGERDPSEWCRQNMEKIEVDEVYDAVRTLLE